MSELRSWREGRRGRSWVGVVALALIASGCSSGLAPQSRAAAKAVADCLKPKAVCLDQDLSGMDLSGMDLSGVNLSGSRFDGASVAGTNFSGAVLRGTSWGPLECDVPMPTACLRDRDVNALRLPVALASRNLLAGLVPGFSSEGSLVGQAQFERPLAVAFSADSKVMFVADANNRRVRSIDLGTGVVSTIAGNGQECVWSGSSTCGDGGLASLASLDEPSGLAVDPKGRYLFISDAKANVIRAVDLVNQTIFTIAGRGTAGKTGDGGPAPEANLASPRGLSVDGAGKTLAVADTLNQVIRTIDLSPDEQGAIDLDDFTGVISLLAGRYGDSCTGGKGLLGSSCGIDSSPALDVRFNMPADVAYSPKGGLFVADTQDFALRKIDGGFVSTVVFDDKSGVKPSVVDVDRDGNVFLGPLTSGKVGRLDVDIFAALPERGLAWDEVSVMTTEPQLSGDNGGLAVAPNTRYLAVTSPADNGVWVVMPRLGTQIKDANFSGANLSPDPYGYTRTRFEGVLQQGATFTKARLTGVALTWSVFDQLSDLWLNEAKITDTRVGQLTSVDASWALIGRLGGPLTATSTCLAHAQLTATSYPRWTFKDSSLADIIGPAGGGQTTFFKPDFTNTSFGNASQYGRWSFDGGSLTKVNFKTEKPDSGQFMLLGTSTTNTRVNNYSKKKAHPDYNATPNEWDEAVVTKNCTSQLPTTSPQQPRTDSQMLDNGGFCLRYLPVDHGMFGIDTCNPNDANFVITHDGGVIRVVDGMCLDASRIGWAWGVEHQGAAKCDGSIAQQFSYRPTGDSSFQIVSELNGMCLSGGGAYLRSALSDCGINTAMERSLWRSRPLTNDQVYVSWSDQQWDPTFSDGSRVFSQFTASSSLGKTCVAHSSSQRCGITGLDVGVHDFQVLPRSDRDSGVAAAVGGVEGTVVTGTKSAKTVGPQQASYLRGLVGSVSLSTSWTARKESCFLCYGEYEQNGAVQVTLQASRDGAIKSISAKVIPGETTNDRNVAIEDALDKFDIRLSDPQSGTAITRGLRDEFTRADLRELYLKAGLVADYRVELLARRDGDASREEMLHVQTPGTASEPRSVTAVAAVRGGSAMADVSWTPPLDDGGSTVTSYRVVSVPPGSGCEVQVPETSCSIDMPKAQTPVSFTVAAITGDGPGLLGTSNQIVFTTAGVPDAPSSVGVSLPPGAFRNIDTLLCLTVGAIGQPVGQKACKDFQMQSMTSISGELRINGGCLTNKKNVLTLEGCDQRTAQVWWRDGKTIRNGAHLCLSAPAGTTITGPSVEVANCDGSQAQSWVIPGYQGDSLAVRWQQTATGQGSLPLSYTVTSTPDGKSCTALAPATSCLLTGLNPAKSYSFAVSAVNAAGPSVAATSGSTRILDQSHAAERDAKIAALEDDRDHLLAKPVDIVWRDKKVDEIAKDTPSGPFEQTADFAELEEYLKQNDHDNELASDMMNADKCEPGWRQGTEAAFIKFNYGTNYECGALRQFAHVIWIEQLALTSTAVGRRLRAVSNLVKFSAEGPQAQSAAVTSYADDIRKVIKEYG